MVLGWAPPQTFKAMHVPDPGWSNSAEKPTESGLHKRDWHMDLKYATHFMRKACL